MDTETPVDTATNANNESSPSAPHTKASSSAGSNVDASASKIAEFEPPQAVVNRVMKSVLPDSVQITKDARSAFTRAAGVFIFYLTHCANDISKDKRRSTIYGQDVSMLMQFV